MKSWGIKLIGGSILICNLYLAFSINKLSSIPSDKKISAYLDMLDQTCTELSHKTEYHFKKCSEFTNYEKDNERKAALQMKELMAVQDSAMELISKIRSSASDRDEAERVFELYVQLVLRHKSVLESKYNPITNYINTMMFADRKLIGHSLFVDTEDMIRIKSVFLKEVLLTNINSRMHDTCEYCEVDRIY